MSYNNPTVSKLQDLDNVFNNTIKTYGEFFDGVVKDLNIDKNKNKELADKYYELNDKINKSNKSIRAKKIWRWFLIIFLIFPFVILTKQIKAQEQEVNTLKPELDRYEKELWDQLHKLFSYLSSYSVCENVFSKVIPDISLSPTIQNENSSVWDDINESYYSSRTNCLKFLFTGSLYGNPFLLTTKKVQSWIDVPYTASATISYTNSKGETQFEVVTAVVLWPYPVYTNNNHLLVKTNISPKLTFNNESELKNKGKIDKYYKKRQNEEHMDNEDFDVKFPCARNDEVDFRVFFTVLTQENFVNLINEVGTFRMRKDGRYIDVYRQSEKFNRPKFKNLKNFVNVINPQSNFNHSFLGYSEGDSYNLEELKQQKSMAAAEFLRLMARIQLPIANMPVIVRENYNEINKSNSKQSSILQDQVLAYKAFDRNYRYTKKFRTETIVEAQKDCIKRFNKVNVQLDNVIAHYFVPVPKVIPKLAVGSHGSRWVDVIVQDFIPHIYRYYLMRVDAPEKYKKIDYKFEDGSELFNGVFFHLFDKKPTDDMIKEKLQKIFRNKTK